MNKIKQKTYFNIAAFFSIVVMVFYIGNSYLIETVKNLSLEVVSKKQKIERLNEQSSQVNSIKIGYEYMQEEMNEVSDLIIDYPNIIDFIVEIESVAAKSEIDLDISVSNKKGEYLNDDLSSVSYDVAAAGDFDKLMHFLVYLENLKYLSKIENIRIYYDDKIDAEEIILNANLKVYVKNKDLN